MLLRRLATLLLLAFIAGPVLNVECLLSCVQAGLLTASETCHQAITPREAVSSGDQQCADTQAQASPFLKANELLQAALAVPVFRADHHSAVSEYHQPSGVDSGTGPPNASPPLVPLRI